MAIADRGLFLAGMAGEMYGRGNRPGRGYGASFRSTIAATSRISA